MMGTENVARFAAAAGAATAAASVAVAPAPVAAASAVAAETAAAAAAAAAAVCQPFTLQGIRMVYITYVSSTPTPPSGVQV